MNRMTFKSPSLMVFSVSAILLAGLLAARHVDRPRWDNPGQPIVLHQEEPPAISPEQAQQAIASAKDLSVAFRVASERALPAVVAIETRTTPLRARGQRPDSLPRGKNPFEGTPFEDMFRDFDGRFQMPEMMPQQGLGSGVIIDPSGLILTNNHVVRGPGGRSQVMVRLQDGREFEASQVWTDSQTDIALVKIDGAGSLSAADLADSDRVSVGDWVLALGQPFGLESTVTAGIISATHRGVGIAERENFLQTDAAINPGNSGGPLVNLEGQVVGINTAITSRTGSNSGIGFAVPINVAKWVADQLVRDGKVRRAFLGVGIQEIDAALAGSLGRKPRDGVIVTQVHPDTPAERAGLKIGDVIEEFAGLKVHSPRDLQFAAERSLAGQQHPLHVIRNRKPLNLNIVPEEMPAEFAADSAEDPDDQIEAPSSETMGTYGLDVGELTPELARRLGQPKARGVVITMVEPGSAAYEAGLRSGMIIDQVNGQEVDDVAACRAALEQSTEDPLLLVRVNGGSRFVVLKSSTRG
jgi:serine protease Do